VIKPKAFHPSPDWAHREVTRAVLILRHAAEPLTSRDIALEMLVTRALDKSGYVFPANSKSGHIEEPKFSLSLVADSTGIP
jgi:hypothetical protein